MVSYKLIFSGNIAAGKTADQVRASAIASLKLSEQAADKLFNSQGRPVVIKTVTDAEEAERFVKRFQSIGMVLEVESTGFSLEPLSPDPAKTEKIEPVETAQDGADEGKDGEPGWQGHLLVNLRMLVQVPVVLLAIGLLLAILYSPFPEGLLKNGFLVATVFLFLGFRMLRARA